MMYRGSLEFLYGDVGIGVNVLELPFSIVCFREVSTDIKYNYNILSYDSATT